MTIALTTYNTNDLVGVVRSLPKANSFWRDLCFGSTKNFETQEISFDKVGGHRRMAPFVAPNVQGRPVKSRGYTTESFSPAYIKPKTPVEPDRVLKRQPGEMFQGSLTPDQRRKAIIVDILREHREMIEKRWEWMACEAVVKGSVTVAGEDYPSVTVDFGRHNDQTVTLSGTELWTHADSVPLENIEDWNQQMLLLSTSPLLHLVFGATAWKAFIDHADIKEKLETRRGSELTLETASAIGSSEDMFAYKGQLPGGPHLWIYSDVYENDSGSNVAMVDPTYVVGVGKVDGLQAFGAIMDARAGFRAMPIFPKMWIEEDPSAEMIMSQSAPLMIPRRVNATMRAKVVA